MKKNLLLMVTLLFASFGLAMAQQTITVSGTVVAEKDGQPIAGAYVLANGTTLGAMTNDLGEFVIEDVPVDAKEIIASFLGMTTAKAPVQAAPVKIVMQEDMNYLEDVVVVAYGSAKREAVTGSVTSVKGETLASAPVTSVDKALSGKLAGVQVTAASGQPGAASQIRIRGNSSINASNAPLWVVDGIPVVSGGTGEMTNTSNGIATINPNDIESITVLKDAAAAAVYGSRAANGVILVTTKSGKEGKAPNAAHHQAINAVCMLLPGAVVRSGDCGCVVGCIGVRRCFRSLIPADHRYTQMRFQAQGDDFPHLSVINQMRSPTLTCSCTRP